MSACLQECVCVRARAVAGHTLLMSCVQGHKSPESNVFMSYQLSSAQLKTGYLEECALRVSFWRRLFALLFLFCKVLLCFGKLDFFVTPGKLKE